MSLPILTPAELEKRKKDRRIQFIIEAMRDAPRTHTLTGWAGLTENGVQREYAKAIEPLLKRAEEGELWLP